MTQLSPAPAPAPPTARRSLTTGTIVATLALAVLLAASWFWSNLLLMSFAAIAQFAPSFIGGLIWRRANARGVALGQGDTLTVNAGGVMGAAGGRLGVARHKPAWLAANVVAVNGFIFGHGSTRGKPLWP